MRMDAAGRGMEESWGAVFGGGMDWMEGDGVSVSGGAEMEEEVRRMERVAEMAAAGSRGKYRGDGPEVKERLESWVGGEASGEEERREAEARGAAGSGGAGRQAAGVRGRRRGDALREAAAADDAGGKRDGFPAGGTAGMAGCGGGQAGLPLAGGRREGEAEPASDGGGERGGALLRPAGRPKPNWPGAGRRMGSPTGFSMSWRRG